jgi:hypothetical protein
VIHVLGNLACERDWRGAPPVPAFVGQRIAALATLVRALVDADEVTVWTPVAVEPARIPAVDGLPAVRLAVGVPPPGAQVLAWGASAALVDPAPPRAITAALDPALRAALAAPLPSVEVARAVNDRRFAIDVARAAGVAPARVLTAAAAAHDAETDPILAAAAAESPSRAWIAKAPLTSAGRDRLVDTVPLTPRTRARLATLVAEHGAVTVEPWLDRRRDVAITGAIDAHGAVAVLAPHGLDSDARGTFRGIDVAPPSLAPADAARLTAVAHAAGAALAARGYRGPYTIDAFEHTAGFAPLVEINARLSFGVVARALAARLGRTRLRTGTGAPPPGALVLVAPGARDDGAAWLE